jgi:hypothetical protein
MKTSTISTLRIALLSLVTLALAVGVTACDWANVGSGW